MDARPDHRVALDAHEERGRGMANEQFIQVERVFDIVIGGRGKPGRHPAQQQRQAQRLPDTNRHHFDNACAHASCRKKVLFLTGIGGI